MPGHGDTIHGTPVPPLPHAACGHPAAPGSPSRPFPRGDCHLPSLLQPGLPTLRHSPATQDVEGAHSGQCRPGQALQVVDVSADGKAASLETRGLVDQHLGTGWGERGPMAIRAPWSLWVLAQHSPAARQVSPRRGSPGRRRSPSEATVARGSSTGTSNSPPLKPELVFGTFSFKNKLFRTFFSLLSFTTNPQERIPEPRSAHFHTELSVSLM